MKKLLLLLPLLALMACGGYKTKQAVDANGYKYETVTNDPFKTRIYTLDNGLKVYLSVNQDEPRIQTAIAVKMGAKDDPRDNTGLAHYLEHLMFKGTDKWGTSDYAKERVLIGHISDLFEQHKAAQTKEEKAKIYAEIDRVSQEASTYALSNEYDKLVGSLGASGTNAFTSTDQTIYINDIPSNEIAKFLQLESDRFQNLVLRLFHTELETVYEEFNMYQDMGQMLMYESLFSELFTKHPYHVSVIGLPEHLKNPSMVAILNQYRNYYVPNNMAICMTGDLNFEETIQLVDTYFGAIKPNPSLASAPIIEEDPVEAVKVKEISTPESEMMLLAYRGAGVKSDDVMKLDVIQRLLNNSQAGLIDLNLVQKQKVLWAGVGVQPMNDYSLFYFMATPRQGQKLEEVTQLWLGEIEKIKQGDFDEWMLEAVINDMKLAQVKEIDTRNTAVEFAMSFTQNFEWAEYVSRIDRQSKLTKQEIVDFAKNFFKDNYLVVYKRTGENKDKVAVEKPQITPVTIIRDKQSAWAEAFYAEKTQPIEPVFINFKEKIKTKELGDGSELSYIKNESNALYELNLFSNISSYTDKKLALAFMYLPYLGTDKYSPEDLKKEMYRLGMTFEGYSTENRTYVTMSGLRETMKPSLELVEHILGHVVVNEEAYKNMISDILKQRTNNKLEKGVILRSAMSNYAAYGKKNSFTDILSESDLMSINPQELVDLIKGFVNYKHEFFYYGPEELSNVASALEGRFVAVTPMALPVEVKYPELPMSTPTVYFCNYDMVQAEMMIMAKGAPFSVEAYPAATMFNNFYGAGMSSVVFQEIREARGLAYSAFAYMSTPRTKEDSYYVRGYVGTQADKLPMALSTMKSLLTNMPEADKQFELAKEMTLNNLRSSRLVKSEIFWNYLSLKRLGVNYDIREKLYNDVSKMTIADMKLFFDQQVKNGNYYILVLGDKNRLDFSTMKQYGPIQELSLQELFGY